MKMINGLFDDFNPVSSKQWKQLIQFELKGADYNETLVWNSLEDISVKPFYHSEDSIPQSLTTLSTVLDWKICQSIFVADTKKSNLKALSYIKNGADSLLFIIPHDSICVLELLNNININDVSVHLELQFISIDYVTKIVNYQNEKNNTLTSPFIQIKLDPIAHLTRTGNWFKNINSDFNNFESITSLTNFIAIDATIYQNAGATMVQQIAYSLAHASEYLRILYKPNSNLKKLNISFKLAVGSNYFFEIAKLKALRTLWEAIALKHDLNTNCLLFATPTRRNKTIYDNNSNMLRTTTECMSAILGGANTICNLPYDSIFHKTNKFGERISRNQLLILKHESYFNKVTNPTEGAYYIESLTKQLAEKALELFQEIENQGGFLTQLKTGTIQRKIKESAEKEQKLFNSGNTILVGTNKHINASDKMNNNLQFYPFVKTIHRKTLIEPIIEKRLSEIIEKQRLENER